MPPQHILHSHLLHPPQPLLRICLLIPLPRNEPITLQPPTRHQYENAKRGIAEPEPLRQGLGMRSNQRVDEFDITIIGGGKGFSERGVAASEFEESARGGHA